MKPNTPVTTRQLAFRVAVKFPTYVPTPKQVMAAFPTMDRATAYRYVTDYRNARKAAA